MKKLLFLFALVVFASACENEDITFADFEKQTLYFPYQYPVRTLSLGNDRIDNSLDRQHKFNIGVCVGGFYGNNKRDWRVDFQIDNSLVHDNLYNAAGQQLQALPQEYYTVNPQSRVTIPNGSFTGLIEVQLTDAFFEDPQAIQGNYVIPVKIVGSPDTENILRGTASESILGEPNIHKADNWTVAPMDYTLFGVKYVNPYHGVWLRRGALIVRNTAGQIVDRVVYRSEFVEFDEPVDLKTRSMTDIQTTLNVKSEAWQLMLDLKDDQNIKVTSLPTSSIKITLGSGSYKQDGDAWGGTPENPTKRDVIYLNYFYNRANGERCEVLDTLVFRDRAIKFEVARPTVK